MRSRTPITIDRLIVNPPSEARREETIYVLRTMPVPEDGTRQGVE